MCNECHCYKCPPGCPNADEPEIMYYCDFCDAEIRECEEYAEMPNGDRWCMDCYSGEISIKVAGE